MKFIIPKLPYGLGSLEPIISKKQLELHYNGHLKGYINKLNQMPSIAAAKNLKLESVIFEGKREHVDSRLDVLPPGEHPSTLYQLAAQIYNHTFYFKSLSPNGGGTPSGDIGEIINSQYGSWDKFRKKMIAKCVNLFGSGWVWVVIDDEGNLLILKGLNAETPIVYKGLAPLFCIDVWEHAYYIDYENKRSSYAEAVIDNLINWDFANVNLANAG